MRRADVLLHPVRLRVVQVVAAAREATVGAVAAALDDVPVPSLYRHLRQLVDAGLLEVARERKVRGATEKTYRLPTDGDRLGPAEIAGAGAEDHARWFMVFLMGLYRELEVYLGRGDIDFARDGVGYHTTPLWLDDEELGDFARELRAVVGRYAERPATAGRRPLRLSTVLLPAADVAAAEAGGADSGRIPD